MYWRALLVVTTVSGCASQKSVPASARAPAPAELPSVTLAEGIDLGQVTISGDELSLDGVVLIARGPFTWRREGMDGEWILPLQAALEKRRWEYPPEQQGSLSTRGYLRISAEKRTAYELVHPVMLTAASLGIRQFRLDAVDELFGIAMSLPRSNVAPEGGHVVLLELTAKNVLLTARDPGRPVGADNPVRRRFALAELAEMTSLLAKNPAWSNVTVRVAPTVDSTWGALLSTLTAVLRTQPGREGYFEALSVSPWTR